MFICLLCYSSRVHVVLLVFHFGIRFYYNMANTFNISFYLSNTYMLHLCKYLFKFSAKKMKMNYNLYPRSGRDRRRWNAPSTSVILSVSFE